jgi:hypothetical protein
VNDTLSRALSDARLDVVAVASSLGVDPKTVERWIAGRRPRRRNRWRLADLVGRHERDLWPELAAESSPTGTSTSRDLIAVYPHRGAVPREVWRGLFASAEQEIGVLVYAGLFLAEDAELLRLLADRARDGVRVRLLLGDPDGSNVAVRGAEEGIGDLLAAKIRNVIVLCRPLLPLDSVEIRLHDSVLYNSIYRGDDELLVNTHVYSAAAAHAPVLHLRAAAPGDLVATYLASFERVWSAATPLA